MTDRELNEFMTRIELRDENLGDILKEVYDLGWYKGKEYGEDSEWERQNDYRNF